MIDKAEFMSVSGLERMGFNDEYLAGQQGDEFIIYKLVMIISEFIILNSK